MDNTFHAELSLVARDKSGNYVNLITLSYEFNQKRNGEFVIEHLQVTNPSDFHQYVVTFLANLFNPGQNK
jgi:hypothetical protein